MNTQLHLLRLLNVRHIRRGWVRALASVVGVAIGVACFVFGPALTMSISAQIGLTLNDLSGQADLEARGLDGGLPSEAVAAVRAVDGVALAAPLAQSGVKLAGQPELLVVLGVDAGLDRDMREYRVARGDFLSGPGQVLLGDSYAAEKGLEPGAEVTLISMGGSLTLRLAGTLSAEKGVGRLNSGDLAVVSLEDAFSLTGKQSVDTISIQAAPGTDTGVLAAALRDQIGAEALVEPPEGRYQGKETFSVALNVLMALIGTLAIVIGLMLIYNTMAISVAQRRAEIGILRALGMERGAVRGLYVAEALALGLIGSLLGAGLGLLLVNAGNNVSLMPDFTQGFSVASREAIRVTPALLLVAILAGVGSALLAAQLPAQQTARLDPVNAMAQVRAETGRLRFSWRAVVAGIGLCAVMLIGPFLLRVGTLEGIIAGSVAIYGILSGMFLFVGPLLAALSGVLPGLMYRLAGSVGLIAADNILRRPKRSLFAVAFMMLGVAIAVQIAGTNFGFQNFVEEWSGAENTGDLVVMGLAVNPLQPALSLPADVIADVRADPGVAAVVAERVYEREQDGVQYALRAIDIDAFQATGGQFAWGAGDEAAAMAALADPAQPVALASTGFLAAAHGAVSGATVRIGSPAGEQALHIAGTYLGTLETERIVLIVNRVRFERLWGDSAVDRLTVKLRPGADVQAVRRDWLRQYALRGVMVFDAAEVRAAFAENLNIIANTSRLMTLVTSVSFFAGLAGMFMVAVIDRRRELGMLRAVGMTRRQIAAGILLEATLVTLIGAVIAVPGVVLIHVLQAVTMQQVMGIRFRLEPREVGLMLLVAVGVALVSAYLPARSASRTDILEAMRWE